MGRLRFETRVGLALLTSFLVLVAVLIARKVSGNRFEILSLSGATAAVEADGSPDLSTETRSSSDEGANRDREQAPIVPEPDVDPREQRDREPDESAPTTDGGSIWLAGEHEGDPSLQQSFYESLDEVEDFDPAASTRVAMQIPSSSRSGPETPVYFSGGAKPNRGQSKPSKPGRQKILGLLSNGPPIRSNGSPPPTDSSKPKPGSELPLRTVPPKPSASAVSETDESVPAHSNPDPVIDFLPEVPSTERPNAPSPQGLPTASDRDRSDPIPTPPMPSAQPGNGSPLPDPITLPPMPDEDDRGLPIPDLITPPSDLDFPDPNDAVPQPVEVRDEDLGKANQVDNTAPNDMSAQSVNDQPMSRPVASESFSTGPDSEMPRSVTPDGEASNDPSSLFDLELNDVSEPSSDPPEESRSPFPIEFTPQPERVAPDSGVSGNTPMPVPEDPRPIQEPDPRERPISVGEPMRPEPRPMLTAERIDEPSQQSSSRPIDSGIARIPDPSQSRRDRSTPATPVRSDRTSDQQRRTDDRRLVPSRSGAVFSTTDSLRALPKPHRVRNDETLFSICQHEYGDRRYARSLWYANRKEIDDPRRLDAGMILWVPQKPQIQTIARYLAKHDAVSRSGTGSVSKPPAEDSRQSSMAGQSAREVAQSARPREPRSNALEATQGQGRVDLTLPSSPSAARSARTVQPSASTTSKRGSASSEEMSYRLYTVRDPHESLYSIARDVLGNMRWVKVLEELNRDRLDEDRHFLPTGTVLRIPDLGETRVDR